MSLIELTHVEKRYGTAEQPVYALRDVSLTVARGEFVAIVGQSGSGKSTLMHCIGCLDRPTAGRCCLDGRDVARLGDRALSQLRSRTIGFVFQRFCLLPELTALENAALPLRYRRIPPAERMARARAALEQVGLGERLAHRPAQLSGGQQQRVAIARALAAEPELLLADEPTGNLDSAAGAAVLRLLRALHSGGRTVLLITHDPAVAAAAPREVRLQNGEIVYDITRNL